MIYKLLRPAEWAEFQARGRFAGSRDDLRDGYMHFSTPAQLAGTAAKHFSRDADLILAEVDPARLPKPLKWEPARGGQLFPHLYDALPLSAVTRHWPLPPPADDIRVFPGDLREA